ncbi:DEAD/DEAH box helicase [Sulfolobus islandicus]|uniref:Helicase domain protein n=1 Tax=Saccharolobus islandicus (strain HVE10/4) TaxID=930943 RepID=F0NPM3_SACI0|nr:DEAD/DEAH box helicase [Sulfolobus islandicus]ADX82780.1 helicase domain protein [Sulfolobus islandicus HVE10/4]WCM38412.1 DEAD/DEAH box helicase [Sulfolobus islandicus]
MSNQINEEEIEIYQDLLRAEVSKFINSQNRDFKNALLTEDDIDKIIINYREGRVIFENLLNKGMIIKCEGKYRTAHMDLLAKAAFIRQFVNTEPYPLEFDIMLNEEAFPDFGSFSIYKLLQIINAKLNNDNLPQAYIDIINEIIKRLLNDMKINGLSSFQGYMIDKILNTNYPYIPLVAPTATGKTITFVIPSIIYLLESILKGEEPINVLFVYPRKALAKDQVEKFIKYLDIINNELSKHGINKKITIALEDGDTPSKREIKEEDSYRGLKCPRCKGDLIYTKGSISCNKCRRIYDFIIPTKEEIKYSPPNVLITNLWILYRRLLNMNTVNNFKNIKYIVLDEVHAYDGVLYYHLRFILRLLFSLKQLTKAAKIEKLIFSSATIPNYREFISKLVCCGNGNCIPEDILTYSDFYEKNKNSINKKRLILYEFLLPNVGRGVETLTEDVTEVVLAWLRQYKFKGILFADSISGVTNFFKYFRNTILGERQAREIRDHICYKDPADLCNYNEYYWSYLSSYRKAYYSDTNLEMLARDLLRGIDQHYSMLSLQERIITEERFKNDPSMLLLFSTSTLELGIDIGDVAVVVQHKLPLSRESFIQRVGRAGRSNNTYRIATGIIVLQSTPFASLYMFNQNLRNLLINASYTSLIKSIDAINPQIIMQYIFSYLLLKRAINKYQTCVDDGSKIEVCENILKDLIDEVYKNLNNNNFLTELQNALCISLDSIKDDLWNLINLLEITNNSAINKSDNCKYMVDGVNKDINDSLSTVSETRNILSEWLEDTNNYEIYKYSRPLLIIINNIYNKIEQLKDILYNNFGNLALVRKVLDSIKAESCKLNPYINGLKKYESKLQSQKNIVERMKNKTLINNIENAVKHLEDVVEKVENLIKDLNDIINNNNYRKCLDMFNYFNKNSLIVNKDQNYDIFKVMREEYTKDMFVDLLMTPPSPTIELIGTEEGDDYE